ncbi:MAG: protein kinase [Leptolyngbyaceae cyanobacterium]
MSSSSIFCSQGHENSADNRFCRVCGELLVHPQPHEGAIASPSPPQVSDPYCGIMVGQRYQIQRQLGLGGFGRTYLAEDINRFHELCVLKEFAPQVSDPGILKKAEQLFEREAGVLYHLQHDQIPCFRELLRAEMEGIVPATVPTQMRLFLVQDYVNGQTYQDLLEERQHTGQSFTEAEMLQLLQHILPVLAYVHDKGVIHRDISPDNLIQRECDRLPILIDFGGVKQAAMTAVSGTVANSLNETNETNETNKAHGVNEVNEAVAAAPVTIVGKQGYAPPEQMAAGQVSPHSDFYALGVTVLVLMTGQSPYHLLDPNSPGFWQAQLSLSPLFTRVLRKMLAVYPSDRYTTAADIITTLFPSPQPPIIQPAATPAATPTPAPSTARTVAVAPVNQPPATPIPTPISTPIPAPIPAPVPAPSAGSSAPTLAPTNVATQTIPTPGPSPAPRPRPPVPPRTPSRLPAFNLPMPLLTIALVLMLGSASAWVGYSVLPQWFAGLTQTSEDSENNDENGGDLEPSAQFSEAEQQRKANLQEQRDRLGISGRFLVQLTDDSFYEEYPGQRGRALTTDPRDEVWRERWDGMAADWLTQLETLFTPGTRSKLGRYGQADRNQWRTIANSLNVSSRALYDLADAQFFSTFSDRQDDDFLDQPIGQLWHGMVAQQLAQMQSGAILETIQFDPGDYQTTLRQRLQPGQGHVYLLNAQADQLMRLNLNAPRTRLSIYVPRPTDAVPLLLEDSTQQTWSGELPQSGYYEIVVILDHPALSDRASDRAAAVQLTVAVDNVSSSGTTDVTGDSAGSVSGTSAGSTSGGTPTPRPNPTAP